MAGVDSSSAAAAAALPAGAREQSAGAAAGAARFTVRVRRCPHAAAETEAPDAGVTQLLRGAFQCYLETCAALAAAPQQLWPWPYHACTPDCPLLVHAADVYVCLASGQVHVCTAAMCDRKAVQSAQPPPSTPMQQFLVSGVHACGVADDGTLEVCDLTGRVYEQEPRFAMSYEDEQREERASKKFRRGDDGLSLHVRSATRLVRGANTRNARIDAIERQSTQVKQRTDAHEAIAQQMKLLKLDAEIAVREELCDLWQRLTATQKKHEFTRVSAATFAVVVLYSMANGGEHYRNHFYVRSHPHLRDKLGPLKAHAPHIVHPSTVRNYRRTDALVKRLAIAEMTGHKVETNEREV